MILWIDTKSKDVISVTLKKRSSDELPRSRANWVSAKPKGSSRRFIPGASSEVFAGKNKTSDDDSFVDKVSDENEYGSQVLLPLITKILMKNKLEFKDLKGIRVETGPGSYTGLKVGASVANALGYALGIPVNGKKIETELQYS